MNYYLVGKLFKKMKKYDQALKYFEIAVKDKCVKSAFEIGQYYFSSPNPEINVVGLSDDDTKSFLKYYHIAAELGHSASQHKLGILYSQGIFLDKDRDKGLKWFNLAADQGHEYAKKNVIKCKNMKWDSILISAFFIDDLTEKWKL